MSDVLSMIAALFIVVPGILGLNQLRKGLFGSRNQGPMQGAADTKGLSFVFDGFVALGHITAGLLLLLVSLTTFLLSTH